MRCLPGLYYTVVKQVYSANNAANIDALGLLEKHVLEMKLYPSSLFLQHNDSAGLGMFDRLYC